MAGGMAASRARRPAPPVVVALGTVDPALVVGVLDVLGGREPQAVADPAWRTYAPKEDLA